MHVSLLDQSQVKKVEEKRKDTLAREVEATRPAGEISENVLNVKVTVVINIKFVTLHHFYLNQPTPRHPKSKLGQTT